MLTIPRKINTAYKIILQPFFRKICNTAVFVFTGSSIRLVINGWFRHCGETVDRNNWGDDINYYIFSEITGREVFNYSSIFHCAMKDSENNYTCIGSVIDKFCDENTIIWGSGVLFGDSELKDKPMRVCAVRGPLSRKYLLDRGVDCPEIYGDPALLLPKIVKTEKTKKYKLGIVPNVADLNNEILKRLLLSDCVKLINPADYGEDWKSVIYDICSCENIASSSLHGLIVADAYGVPNVRVKFSDNVAGGDFKYNDYFLSVSRPLSQPISMDENIGVNDIINVCKSWKPIIFDIKPLIDSCPFELNIK